MDRYLDDFTVGDVFNGSGFTLSEGQILGNLRTNPKLSQWTLN